MLNYPCNTWLLCAQTWWLFRSFIKLQPLPRRAHCWLIRPGWVSHGGKSHLAAHTASFCPSHSQWQLISAMVVRSSTVFRWAFLLLPTFLRNLVVVLVTNPLQPTFSLQTHFSIRVPLPQLLDQYIAAFSFQITHRVFPQNCELHSEDIPTGVGP